MNKALLDTDIYSEVLKAVDQNVARNAAAYRRTNGFLTISVITVMEVIQGLQKVGGSNRIQAFRNAIAPEEILPFDQDAADLAGRIAGGLDRVGRPIGRCDIDNGILLYLFVLLKEICGGFSSEQVDLAPYLTAWHLQSGGFT